MPPDISDETLMAFADGALDEPLFGTIADAVEADADLALRLEALVQGAALARSGYAEMLAPVPPALEAGVRKTIARSERGSFWQDWGRKLSLSPLGLPVAAAAIALVAFPAGYLLAPQSSGPGDISSTPSIAAALDTLPSGESLSIDAGLDITTVASFTDAQGQLCREYETSGRLGAIVLACHGDDGWATRFSVAMETGSDLYAPASGTETLDAYLQTIGANAPMDAEAEAEALAGIAVPR